MLHPKVVRLLEHKHYEQKSEAWLNVRKKLLTASDFASVIGLNKYKSADDLLRDKLHGSTFKGNEATRHGEAHEDIALDKWCRLVNKRADYCGNNFGLIVHHDQELNWLAASPDGITHDGICLEIKCPLRREITPEVPLHYLPQVIAFRAL